MNVNVTTFVNVDTIDSLLLTEEDKPQSREISCEACGSIDYQFTDYLQRSA